MWKRRKILETTGKVFPVRSVEKFYAFPQQKFLKILSTGKLWITLWKMWKTLPLGVDVDGDLFDGLVERRIGFHLLFDLLKRMENGRMVTLSKVLSDVGR